MTYFEAYLRRGLLALLLAALLAGSTTGTTQAECFMDKPETERPKPAEFVIGVPWTVSREVKVLNGYDSGHHKNRKLCDHANDLYAIDFDLDGDDVAAVAAGRVAFAGEATGGWAEYGTIVFLDHGDFQSLYAHLRPDSLRVKTDQPDPVAAGAVLGKADSSGNQTTPHLHFALYYHADFQRTPANRGPYGGLAVKPEPMRGDTDYSDLHKDLLMKRAAAGAQPSGPRPPDPNPGGPTPPAANPVEGWLRERSEAIQRQVESWARQQQERLQRELEAWLERQAQEVARQAERALRQTCGAGLLSFPLLGFVALEWRRRRPPS